MHDFRYIVNTEDNGLWLLWESVGELYLFYTKLWPSLGDPALQDVVWALENKGTVGLRHETNIWLQFAYTHKVSVQQLRDFIKKSVWKPAYRLDLRDLLQLAYNPVGSTAIVKYKTSWESVVSLLESIDTICILDFNAKHTTVEIHKIMSILEQYKHKIHYIEDPVPWDTTSPHSSFDTWKQLDGIVPIYWDNPAHGQVFHSTIWDKHVAKPSSWHYIQNFSNHLSIMPTNMLTTSNLETVLGQWFALWLCQYSNQTYGFAYHAVGYLNQKHSMDTYKVFGLQELDSVSCQTTQKRV
jgi:hypothetical protein